MHDATLSLALVAGDAYTVSRPNRRTKDYQSAKRIIAPLRLDRSILLQAGWTRTALDRFGGMSLPAFRWGSYGSYSAETYSAVALALGAQTDECQEYFRALTAKRESRRGKIIDLLAATREASRSAHRWRDRASNRWEEGSSATARLASDQKRHWYALKDRGILALHRAGVLRYAGATPQEMAVYEYGNGGLSCLHSTWHPRRAKHRVIEGHPETLFVPAKGQEYRLVDVEFTLGSLPAHTSGYRQVAAPRMPREERPPIRCWSCGQLGHTRATCWEVD